MGKFCVSKYAFRCLLCRFTAVWIYCKFALILLIFSISKQGGLDVSGALYSGSLQYQLDAGLFLAVDYFLWRNDRFLLFRSEERNLCGPESDECRQCEGRDTRRCCPVGRIEKQHR